jgi:hypothetical protein
VVFTGCHRGYFGVEAWNDLRCFIAADGYFKAQLAINI